MAMSDDQDRQQEIDENSPDNKKDDKKDEYQAVDNIIDGYIENLKETKKDPKKKEEFIKAYASRGQEKQVEKQQKPPEHDPLDDVEIQHPPRTHDKVSDDDIEDDNYKDEEVFNRVIPSGDPEEAIKKHLHNSTDEDSDDIENKPRKKPQPRPAEVDEDVQSDADVLADILGKHKLKQADYVIKNYFKRTYATIGSSARYLNQLLRNAGVTPRSRRMIIDSFLDISPKVLNRIFEEEEELDEDDDAKKSKDSVLDDSNEIVEIPMKLNGEIVLKKDGTPETIKWRKKDIRALQMQSQMSGGGGNLNMEMLEMMTRSQDKSNQQVHQLMERDTEFWKRAASGDPLDSMLNQKEKLKKLGIVQDVNVERPSDYQKVVVTEVRNTLKDGFNETKGEFKPLFEMFRDDIAKPLLEEVREGNRNKKSGSTETTTTTTTTPRKELPKPVKDIDPDEKDEIFAQLNRIATAELAEDAKTSVKKPGDNK